MTLNDLLRLPPLPGTHRGTCRMCAEPTDCGWAQAPSSKFSAWAQLADGDVFCERCWAALKDPRLRRASWIAFPGELVLATKDNRALATLLVNPPIPPFAVYVTRAGKKQGWIPLMRRVTISAQQIYVGTDWTDAPVLCPRGLRERCVSLASALRRWDVPRAALASGQFSARQVEQALTGGYLQLLRDVDQFVGNPVWEVVCHGID